MKPRYTISFFEVCIWKSLWLYFCPIVLNIGRPDFNNCSFPKQPSSLNHLEYSYLYGTGKTQAHANIFIYVLHFPLGMNKKYRMLMKVEWIHKWSALELVRKVAKFILFDSNKRILDVKKSSSCDVYLGPSSLFTNTNFLIFVITHPLSLSSRMNGLVSQPHFLCTHVYLAQLFQKVHLHAFHSFW